MNAPLKKEQILFYVQSCASFNLRKAARVMTQYFDQVLRPTGLRSTQLVILLAAGLKEKTTMSELSEAVVSDRTTLTRALRPLLRKGLLKNQGGSDRRKSGIVLTLKGHQAIRQAAPYWHKAQSKVEKGFGGKNWKGFVSNLDAAIRIVRQK
ncbi:MAG TPA: MarR family winged helix-turn-helix transcriptional regulator [bacterium]|nr:MarR family winged helix-turn-helix transcriptional regulator [bacterium]